MKVLIQIRQHAESVKDQLRADGWQFGEESFNSVSAQHPLVSNEREARSRLHALGLLTSGALRVEFPMRGLARTGR